MKFYNTIIYDSYGIINYKLNVNEPIKVLIEFASTFILSIQ